MRRCCWDTTGKQSFNLSLTRSIWQGNKLIIWIVLVWRIYLLSAFCGHESRGHTLPEEELFFPSKSFTVAQRAATVPISYLLIYNSPLQSKVLSASTTFFFKVTRVSYFLNKLNEILPKAPWGILIRSVCANKRERKFAQFVQKRALPMGRRNRVFTEPQDPPPTWHLHRGVCRRWEYRALGVFAWACIYQRWGSDTHAHIQRPPLLLAPLVKMSRVWWVHLTLKRWE